MLAGLLPSLTILFYGLACGYRLNWTPSQLLGLWRIRPLTGAVATGDLVFVCPPHTTRFREALTRGYLRAGLCPGGYGPLIKTVIALEGQRFGIGRVLRIDGRVIEHSDVQSSDGRGRPLSSFKSGIVPAGHVFLYSSFYASWDSRYFGPVPADGILGLAEEVLTYAP
nr:conjugative transfer signal peptidase TraF [Ensifer adhaerens]